ncbi:hypothetical protein CR513_13120, partial [Mucuna pruriens]
MVLVKVEPSPKAIFFQPADNKEELRANLDLLQEEHEIAHVREYATKAKASQRYNARVFPRSLQKHNLVLKIIFKDTTSNKICKDVGQGANRLEHLDEKRVPRTWNATSSRKYYS